MNNMRSIDRSVKIMKKKGVKFALMHTTNSYPTPDESVRLVGILELKRKYKNTQEHKNTTTRNNTIQYEKL